MLIPQTVELRQSMPVGLPERIELSEVPFFPQSDYQCGPAALATALSYLKVPITPEQLVEQVYLPARQGSLQVEMLAAARRNGVVSYQLAPRFENMLREVAAGNPVIVLQDYGVWPVSLWHYAVVVGYDYANGDLFLRSGEKKRLIIPFGVFEYTWKESDYWAMVTVPPDRIPVTATEPSYQSAVIAMERSGDPRATRAAFASFLQRWPDNIAAAIGLANSHHGTGELKQAEAVLRQAAERHPESVAVLNNLAQTLSDQDKGEDALAFIDRAISLGGPFMAEVKETREAILQRMKQKRDGSAYGAPSTDFIAHAAGLRYWPTR